MEDLAVGHFAAVPLGASLPFHRAKQALLNIAQLHAFLSAVIHADHL